MEIIFASPGFYPSAMNCEICVEYSFDAVEVLNVRQPGGLLHMGIVLLVNLTLPCPPLHVQCNWVSSLWSPCAGAATASFATG